MAYKAKTGPTDVSVDDFLAAVPDPKRRADAEVVRAVLAEVSGEPAVMWGPSIVGFGAYHYVYDSGHSGDAPLIGFSPRKANLVLYLMADPAVKGPLLERLGKHKTGVGCLYVNRLDDLDLAVLRELATASLAWTKAKYPA